MAVGDVMLARLTGELIQTAGPDAPFVQVLVYGIPQPADDASTQVIQSLVAREYRLYLPGPEPGDITE